MKQIQPKPIEQWPRDSSAKTKLSLTADLIYIHLLFKTHRNFSVHYYVPNMEVIGISNTSERCSAEGRITVLVRDSTGKLLNLDLGIGYSSRLVPKSIISVAQLMTKGSIFSLRERKLLPTYLPINRFLLQNATDISIYH